MEFKADGSTNKYNLRVCNLMDSNDSLLRIESQLDNEMIPYKFDLSLFENINNLEIVLTADICNYIK